MDLDTGIICIAVIGISVAVVVLTSIFGMKETSYEEAVLQQRTQLTALEPQALQSKDKSKKPKSAKKKPEKQQQPYKRGKSETEEEKRDVQEGQRVVSSSQIDSSPPEVIVTTQVDKLLENDSVPGTKTKRSGRKSDHIEFTGSDKVIELNEQEDVDYIRLAQRRVSTDLRPKKPILLKKPGGESESEVSSLPGSPVTAGDRINSFEAVHPKDEFELMKHQKEKKNLAAKPNGPAKDLLTPDVKIGESIAVNEVTSSNGHELTNGTNNKNSLVKDGLAVKKPKQSHKSNMKQQNEKLTPKGLVESIKSLALTQEEVQSIINELLNHDSEDAASLSHNWLQVTCTSDGLCDINCLL